MSGIFGGSKQRSSSSNRAYDSINASFSPLFGQSTSAANQIQALLGGDASGFEGYKRATGFDAMAEQGARGITGSGAARGLLRSGSTGKALQGYGQNIQNQFANQYIQQLLGLGDMGLKAGGLVAGTGQTSTSSGRSKPGISGLIGQGISAIAASDKRLKKNIFKVGTTKDGLSIYQYRYIDNSGPYIGVMAQEVAKKKPEALGPVVDGYMTVDYGKIEGVI